MHEWQCDRSIAAAIQDNDPAGLEGDLKAEPSAVEVTAVAQAVGDDDRVTVNELHQRAPCNPPWRRALTAGKFASLPSGSHIAPSTSRDFRQPHAMVALAPECRVPM
jgi:hypothetical protein